ncbi:MAG: integrin [Myxococcales bacterium]|nr:integrin [Myxococcales bacterium]
MSQRLRAGFAELVVRCLAICAVSACGDKGSRPDAAPPSEIQYRYLKASNTGTFDFFGRAIALSADGSTLAVGAPGEASAATGIGGDEAGNGARNAGAVYVFTRSGSSWTQQAYLKASNAGIGDRFGDSLAISADGATLAVGAPNESSDAVGVNGNQANDAAPSAGAAYVFTRAGGAWTQQAYLKASNTAASDLFGSSVALSNNGSTLAVGAYQEASAATGINGDQTSDAATQAGAAYVFTRSGLAWSQQAYVKASNTRPLAFFGSSVALSGDGARLAVAARLESSNAVGVNGDQADTSAMQAGAVYVFARSGASWTQEAYVKPSNTGAGDRFGTSLAFSNDGSILAASADREDSAAAGVGGNQLDNGALDAGAAYVFTRSGATWTQQAYVKPSNTGADDAFGTSLALAADGSTLAIGAHQESSAAVGVDGDSFDNSALQAGAVYVFTRAGASWRQRSYVKASHSAAFDEFGISVALSADGALLAAGAHTESSSATGIGGDELNDLAPQSGAVYLVQ